MSAGVGFFSMCTVVIHIELFIRGSFESGLLSYLIGSNFLDGRTHVKCFSLIYTCKSKVFSLVCLTYVKRK